MKKFRSVLAVGLAAAMIVGTMAACTTTGTDATDDTKTAQTEAGGNTDTGSTDTGNTDTDDTPAAYTYEAELSNDGKVLNIYTWNTEFLERFVAYYPDFEGDLNGGTIGDVKVVFTTVPSDNNAYQDNLDAALLAQAEADADDKVDIFLLEADYALKYVDTNYTVSLADLGITDSDLADQYQYTKDVVTDQYGNIKGSSWQGCPGALIYRADIAEEVLGTSDPDEVQEYVKDWDTFLETAAKLADKGYNITSTVNDSYRVFSNNVTSKWVVNGTINVDANIEKWVEMSKAMVDAGETSTEALWSSAWSEDFYYTTGNAFCYFGPAWLIDFSMKAGEDDAIATDGGWRICKGPQGFYWGGTWVAAANGTDNADLVADIIKVMTTDDSVLEKIITEKNDFVNDSALIEKYSNDENFGDAVLGGQNGLAIFSEGVSTVDLSNTCAYDQGCNEEFQSAMKDYFDGNYATYEEALAAFYTAVTTKYPALSAPQ